MSVCPYSSTGESRARSSERARERERNAHSTARHLSVPVHCLRKCTLILAIKEQIVRGAMPALTAAVQWSRLQGGSRLAKTLSPPSVFSFLGLYRLPPPLLLLHHHHPKKKKCFCARVSVRRALGWKKPLHTDVGGGERQQQKPDECVIRLASVPANVPIREGG